HPGVYDAVMAAQAPAERQLAEGTLGGLRFVRNWLGRQACLAEVIETGGVKGGPKRSTDWAREEAPKPETARPPPPARRRPWERARYRAYQDCLAGHTIGDTLGLAVTFLTLTGASAESVTDASQWATRSS